MSLLTKKGSFKLQKDAIHYFGKLPLGIQIGIVDKVANSLGWSKDISIDMSPNRENSDNIFELSLRDHLTDQLLGNSYENAISNYGFYHDLHLGNTILTKTKTVWGMQTPSHSRNPENNPWGSSGRNNLKTELNKVLKSDLPNILINDYPEYAI
jgi:hypothetical protein